MARRRELADARWEAIRERLPGKTSDPGRTAAAGRLFVGAVLFVAKTGIPWEDLPERFGRPGSVWRRFDRSTAGARPGRPGRRAGGAGPGRTAPGLHHGQGPPDRLDWPAPAGGKQPEADQRRCLGRSRGGLATKIDAAVDAGGRAARPRLAAGQRGDAPRAEALPDGFGPARPGIGFVVADAAHGSDAIRGRVHRLKAKACIGPNKACIGPNPTRRARRCYDGARHKHGDLIERVFAGIKRFRRVATRYEEKAENYLGFVRLAAVLTTLN